MFIPGMDTVAMIAQNQERLNGLDLTGSVEKLGTGFRVNRGADAPSGLAIGTGMSAQLRGIATSLHNLEESLHLLRTADGAMSEISEILLRQRDLALQGANEAIQYTVTSTNPAVVNFSSERTLFNEMMTLDMEIYGMVKRHKFNTKQVLSGYELGQDIQAGPDNKNSHRIDAIIPDLGGMGRSAPVALPGNITHGQFVTAFQNAIEAIDDDIATISDARASVGAQDNIIMHSINDLNQQYANIAASRSEIMDADMAKEATELTKTQIRQYSATHAATLTQAERGMVSTMLIAVGLDGSA